MGGVKEARRLNVRRKNNKWKKGALALEPGMALTEALAWAQRGD